MNPSSGNRPLRLLVIGAHPDDAEFKAGGLATLYRRRGHEVKFISMTNGDAGHHVLSGGPLADRRREEAGRAAGTIGAEADVWDIADGYLVPDIRHRERIIRAIRTYAPDLLLTHRSNDYHPDHRYTSLLVQDACYLLTVPAICPETPHLKRDPVVAYLSDEFRTPTRFDPSVAVDIAPAWSSKVAMLAAHESQFFEWLPANRGKLHMVPEAPEARVEALGAELLGLSRNLADRCRAKLAERYGEVRAGTIEKVEAFEASEYGAPLDDEAMDRLFPIGLEAEAVA